MSNDNYTIASNDSTIKASNMERKISPMPSEKPRSKSPITISQEMKKKRGWAKLKRLMGVYQKKENNNNENLLQGGGDLSPVISNRQRAQSSSHVTVRSPKSLAIPQRTRSHSTDQLPNINTSNNKNNSPKSAKEKIAPNLSIDEAVRGRLDGLDILSLGPARRASIPRQNFSHRDEDLHRFISTMTTNFNTSSIATEMLWTSGGKDPPEIILEGYLPGGADRWVVRLEKTAAASKQAAAHNIVLPALTPTDDELDCSSSIVSCDNGASNLIFEELFSSLWRSEESPASRNRDPVSPQANTSIFDEDEDIMELAAACSVPIDIDEGAFMVDSAPHMQSILQIATGPLKRGKFDSALDVFYRTLKGFQGKYSKKPHYLIGSTYHNIGIIKMWKGDFSGALDVLTKAVQIRRSTLPLDHPDIATSLLREGICHFALGYLDAALVAMQLAGKIYSKKTLSRAKILNNIGVIQYHLQDFIMALKSFAGALEIQRKWLRLPVRRESVIFDSSIFLSNMGKLYVEKQDFDTANAVFEESLMLQTTIFRNENEIVVTSVGNIAYTKAKKGETERALTLYTAILQVQEVVYGLQSKEVAETVGIIAYLHKRDQDMDQALKHFSAVRRWLKKNYKESHPCCVHVNDTMKKIEAKSPGVWI